MFWGKWLPNQKTEQADALQDEEGEAEVVGKSGLILYHASGNLAGSTTHYNNIFHEPNPNCVWVNMK
jgi:hypothetical protein